MTCDTNDVHVHPEAPATPRQLAASDRLLDRSACVVAGRRRSGSHFAFSDPDRLWVPRPRVLRDVFVVAMAVHWMDARRVGRPRWERRLGTLDDVMRWWRSEQLEDEELAAALARAEADHALGSAVRRRVGPARLRRIAGTWADDDFVRWNEAVVAWHGAEVRRGVHPRFGRGPRGHGPSAAQAAVLRRRFAAAPSAAPQDAAELRRRLSGGA